MKNTILILGLVLLMALFMGCAGKQTPPVNNGTQVASNNTSGGVTAGGQVTQDDLNKLKQGIEGINPEDLGQPPGG